MSTQAPADKFRAAMKQILSVPKAEVLRREKEEKQKRKGQRAQAHGHSAKTDTH